MINQEEILQTIIIIASEVSTDSSASFQQSFERGHNPIPKHHYSIRIAFCVTSSPRSIILDFVTISELKIVGEHKQVAQET